MGYDIKVGNAVPEHHKDDFPTLSARWVVEHKTLEEAPSFEGDEMTGQSNMRSPSYGTWTDFCRATGLYDMFYEEYYGFLANHPGCRGITQHDADEVTAALVQYRAKAKLPPGFEKDYGYSGPPNFDYNLARLIWLEFWMQWAVKNCETPAIQNT
jgi:hypothetical protein